MIILLTGMLKG